MRFRVPFLLILLATIFSPRLESLSAEEVLKPPIPSKRIDRHLQQPDSGKSKINSEEEQRGTKDRPVFVEILQPPIDSTHTEQKSQKSDSHSTENKTVEIVSAAISAVSAFVIAIFTVFLHRTAKKQWLVASNANSIARDALILSNRPYIHVTFVDPGLKFIPILKHPDGVSLKIQNVGKTPAMISAIKFGYILHPAPDPWPLIQTYMEMPLLEDYLPQGENKRVDRRIVMKGNDFEAVKDGSIALLIFGYIDYMDSLQNRYRLGYGWYYTHEQDPNLKSIANKSYNYDRKRHPGEGNDWEET